MTIRINPWPGQPTKVAIWTGITCNLACTLCGPGASSLWRSELGLGRFDSTKDYNLEPEEIETEVKDYDFSKLDHVTFSGGEPLLNKSTLKILRALRPETSIHFHSNGTTRPDQEYLEQFARFKDFFLVFSIDDIEEQFEYLRWPGKWPEVAENMLWYKENCPSNIVFGFNVVVSKLNEHTYHRVKDWMNNNIPTNNQGVNSVFFTNETNGMLNRFEIKDSRNPVAFLDQLDNQRKTNWRQTFPLAKL